MRGRWNVLAAAVLWSTSGVISKALDLAPLAIAFYRGLFAGLALVPFIPRRSWAFRPALVPLGVAFGVMVGCFLGAVKITTAANAIFLQCTATFWVVPLSAIFLGEQPDRRARVSIALAVLGIILIVGWGYDGRPREWQGILLGLASGIIYAGVIVSMRGLRDLDPIWLSACSTSSVRRRSGSGPGRAARGWGHRAVGNSPSWSRSASFRWQSRIPCSLAGCVKSQPPEAGADRPGGTDPESDLGRAVRARAAGRSDRDGWAVPARGPGLSLLACATTLALRVPTAD